MVHWVPAMCNRTSCAQVDIYNIYIYIYNSVTIHYKRQTISPGFTNTEESHKNIIKQDLIACKIYNN